MSLRTTLSLAAVSVLGLMSCSRPPSTPPSSTRTTEQLQERRRSHRPTASVVETRTAAAASKPPVPKLSEHPCEPQSCANQADRLRKTDRAGARKLDRIGCEGGSAESCWNLSEHGDDDTEIHPAQEAACRLGHPIACVLRARAANPGNDSVARVLTQEQLSYYQLGCHSPMDDPRYRAYRGIACLKLGMASVHGEGTPIDKQRGLEWLQRACALDNVEGCFQAARQLTGGLAFDSEVRRGMKLYRRGCELGEASSCNNLGVIFDKNASFRNAESARSYFEKACTLGNKTGCYNAAINTGNAADAKRFLTKACNLGHKRACEKR